MATKRVKKPAARKLHEKELRTVNALKQKRLIPAGPC